MLDLSGHTLGQYELIDVAGKGGAAVVYLGRQVSIERMVAVKVLAPDFSNEEQFRERFQHEAKMIARLEHDRIVPIYDFGEDEGYYYLVMRLLDSSLSRLIRHGPLSVEQTNHFVQQICLALQYAHDKNVIHRDLKPSNIMLDRDNNAFLTDFGIAKLVGATTITEDNNMLIGTPAYMAPERWQGSEVNVRTDLYALGVTMFEMLRGSLPFSSADTPASLMYHHLESPPPHLVGVAPGVSEPIERVVHRLLSKDPEQRYHNAAEVAEDFQRAAEQTGHARVVIVPEKYRGAQRSVRAAAEMPTAISAERRTPMENADDLEAHRRTTIGKKPRPVRWGRLLGVAVLGAILPLGAFVLSRTLPTAPTRTDTPQIVSVSHIAERPLAPTRVLTGNGEALQALAWSPDGMTIAGGSTEGNIQLWTANGSDSPGQSWPGHLDAIYTMAWQPGQPVLASGGADDVVQVWNVAGSAQTVQTLAGHGNDVNAVAWSPDGAQLATGGSDGRVFRWLTANWQRSNPQFTGSVLALAWSPDGTMLASGGQDQAVRLWTAADWANRVLGNHRSSVQALDWSSDGTRIVSTSEDGEVRLWRADGSGSVTLAQNLPAPTMVHFSPDGARMAAAVGEAIHVWDSQSLLLLATLMSEPTQEISALAWSADGTQVAGAAADGNVYLWDIPTSTPQRVSSGEPISAHTGRINRVIWNADGTQVATASADMTVNLWDAASGERLATLSGAHTTELTAVAWSPDGSQMATGSCDGRVALWDLATSSQYRMAVLPGQQCITGLAYSPDGQFVFNGDLSGSVRGWYTSTGEPMFERLSLQPSGITGLTWTEDAAIFITTGQDGSLRVWQLGTGELRALAMLQANPVALTTLEWGRTDLPSVTGNAEGLIMLWPSLLEREARTEFGRHAASITGASMSANGEWLASADAGGCLAVWNVATAERIAANCAAADAAYTALAWSPTADTFAAGTAQGQLIFWNVP